MHKERPLSENKIHFISFAQKLRQREQMRLGTSVVSADNYDINIIIIK